MGYVIIDGKRHLWRDILELRRQQRRPTLAQPTLFELQEDARPASQRTAAGRYAEPTLFDGGDRSVRAEASRSRRSRKR